MTASQDTIGTVVIGTAFVDIKGFSKVPYDPQGRNLGNIRIVHGGVGRNVAENFANVGMPVSFAGTLEDFAIGRDVERHLEKIGVDLTFMQVAPENGIGMWMVILDENGNLAGSISRMPELSYLEDYILAHGEEIVSKAESIVLEVDLNERIAEKIITLAQRYGKKVYAIVGNLSVIMARPDLLRKTECFICNEIEAAKFFLNEKLTDYTPEELLSYLPSAVNDAGLKSMVVTMGARGAVYYDGEGGICPPQKTEVVDTSGAGDAFFSGTVMALILNHPLKEAVKYGTKLAALTIQSEQTVCSFYPDFFK